MVDLVAAAAGVLYELLVLMSRSIDRNVGGSYETV